MATFLPDCYHGPMSKAECEQLLGRRSKDGAYLIRDSETIEGAMCLCVYKQKLVHTYRLFQTRGGNYTLLAATGATEVSFKSLQDLICHYKRKNQGLAMHLRHAVRRKTELLIRPEPGEPEAEHPRPRRSVPSPGEGMVYENACEPVYVEVLPD